MKLVAYGFLQGDTTEQAAARAGVSERMVFRWKQRPEFRDLLATYQAEVLTEARRKIVALTGKAVATVEKVMDDAAVKGAPANWRRPWRSSTAPGWRSARPRPRGSGAS